LDAIPGLDTDSAVGEETNAHTKTKAKAKAKVKAEAAESHVPQLAPPPAPIHVPGSAMHHPVSLSPSPSPLGTPVKMTPVAVPSPHSAQQLASVDIDRQKPSDEQVPQSHQGYNHEDEDREPTPRFGAVRASLPDPVILPGPAIPTTPTPRTASMAPSRTVSAPHVRGQAMGTPRLAVDEMSMSMPVLDPGVSMKRDA